MKTATYIFLLLAILGCALAAALYLLPAGPAEAAGVRRYGVFEGLQVVALRNSTGGTMYAVEDADGQRLFNVPLRNCLIDTRYRGGQLRFREKATGREGYIDRNGLVTFTGDGTTAVLPSERKDTLLPVQTAAPSARPAATSSAGRVSRIAPVDVRTMARSNPFYGEAVKVVSGKLDVADARRRKVILNYCEHYRTAYTTKDVDFLRQVFSEKALIIVGNVVKQTAGDGKGWLPRERVTLNIHTKQEYLARLARVFAANRKIDVKFSGFHIMRHPTIDGLYGVSLRQQYKSDRYSDDGWLFLLWDFRNESMPVIHVRTWQPASTVSDGDEVINIRDFNIEQ